MVEVSASRVEDLGFESRDDSCFERLDPKGWVVNLIVCICSSPACAVNFFQVKSYQWLKNWHSSGYPARCLALQGQRWDTLAWCQYTVAGWCRNFYLSVAAQKLTEQIRPWDTLACCWDFKQPTNKREKSRRVYWKTGQAACEPFWTPQRYHNRNWNWTFWNLVGWEKHTHRQSIKYPWMAIQQT